MNESYIYDGIRTPFGRFTGGLSSVRPDDLLAMAIKAVCERSGVDGAAIEDVVAGCTNQAGEDSRNVARFAGLLAGLPVSVGGLTVNRLCGSALAALIDTSRAVRCGEGSLFVAGGVESMSRAPMVLSKATQAFDRGQIIADTTIGPRFTNKKIVEEFGNHSMPQTADNVAARLGLSREDCDAYAYASQQKYLQAHEAGFFKEEILPVEVTVGRNKTVLIDTDEHPRPETGLDKLATLRPLFEGGVVTAGNASGINDGAAALLIGDASVQQRFGIAPRARIVSTAIAGVEPAVMGLGPVPASRKALERAGLSMADMDVIEINEAFAAQVLGCLKELGLQADDPRLNPNGGAIALGHPLGASGGRIALTALRQLEKTGGRYALVSMCIGIGQGIAVIIERV
ncbi:MAG: acetyl-CoA C-acyltransferase [Oceanospirillaceae bacterium]|uniref:3-oxoadipyl-CoA thiolase n=1 Tax=unclassified Thalassolituus TaxID=2624967 RepID=UPI000C51717F|nr:MULTISPECIES: 3-oxoadipyl-CoA thiolase [unclassified Thalassolituus]MAS26307.1 acetyl-CoA C-acyltransferase [Oceanospirillaceae bacterium]MBL34634.1 acetyl-CoA C-acyltransferase [Oceanospirillaceae bacterium]MBS52496.1 acetyl-CoA C-acyltransferase [Oceanospirillaceae bacterium]